jgi:hyperosmotically inducible protein
MITGLPNCPCSDGIKEQKRKQAAIAAVGKILQQLAVQSDNNRIPQSLHWLHPHFHHVRRKDMKAKFATSLFVIGTLLSGIVHADKDADREHPLTFVKDSAITTKIKAKFAAEQMKSFVHVNVDTDNHGIVVLSGHARNKEQAEKAVSIARATEGVTEVRNHIQIQADDE